MAKIIFNIIVLLFIAQIVVGPTLLITENTAETIEILPENDNENNLNGERSDSNLLFDNEYVNTPGKDLISGLRNPQFNSLAIITEEVLLGANHVPPEH